MAWPSSMKDKLLLRILNELPLRVVLPLRAVNRQWKMVIETHICKEKKSLKIFSSLKKVLEYYQMLNTQGYLKVCDFILLCTTLYLLYIFAKNRITDFKLTWKSLLNQKSLWAKVVLVVAQ